MNVVVTLAAYNEARNITPVIERILAMGHKVIVVDDGSTDGTADIARRLGAIVSRHPVNMGQGVAVLTGLKLALLDPDSDVVIEMDADGQHRPEEIDLFLERMDTMGADVVVGSRVLGAHQVNASPVRRLFLPYVTRVVNMLSGYSITDSMCGFRAFKVSALHSIAPTLDRMLEPQYLAAEMFIRFGRAGLKVEEVPVRLADRSTGTSNKGMIRYGVGIVRAIVRTLFDLRLGR